MKKFNKKAILVVIASMIIMLPLFSLGSKKNDIFVDDSSTASSPDGSQSEPYKTISDAISHSNKNTEIHIEAGTYTENIEIPKGVEVFGSDVDEVIITAKDKDDAVVTMNDDTELNNVTVKDGKYGIEVNGDDDKISISECVVKDNDSDGIRIQKGSTDKDDAVSITESTIKNNARSGIYSEKRRLVLIDNDIADNGSDGVDFEEGTSAWIEDNEFEDNDGSGLKVRLDSSKIFTKSNTYSGNDHDGIEVVSKGGKGIVDIKKSKISKNDWYGIARINKENGNTSNWNGLTVDKDTKFSDNKLGSISPIIRNN